MRTFTSIELQRQTGDVQRAASQEGVVITSHGKPRNVILSVEEFCRLKRMAGEAVPFDLLQRRSVVVHHVPDRLGYDVRDFERVLDQMSDDAINGINDDAVDVELERVRNMFRRNGR
ncbi:type II toxin-antitoxin system prevent-host-death family antitoxin [Rhizobium sp. BK376]|uniref:type II toxin-antitoxin system prevent-host-death family antitoxin n=1 Tax=Rhizobium sp. BK376 TaxID=2512149 RepID=UPI00104FB038|nr:type II toxin-antitoxin system prevent-host-death family antitoxin [Rhizobium sp. BK376]TCR85275.1 prevent-host-death family protein [Rhizobium sp. BK376]